MYDKKFQPKENKIQTKDTIQPQQREQVYCFGYCCPLDREGSD